MALALKLVFFLSIFIFLEIILESIFKLTILDFVATKLMEILLKEKMLFQLLRGIFG